MGFSAADWRDAIRACLNDEDVGVDVDADGFPYVVELIAGDDRSTSQRLRADLGAPLAGRRSRRLRLETERLIGPKEKRSKRGAHSYSRGKSSSSRDPEAR